MTTTVLTTTPRPTYGTRGDATTRAPFSRPATAGSCPGAAPEQDCPFCSGPETD